MIRGRSTAARASGLFVPAVIAVSVLSHAAGAVGPDVIYPDCPNDVQSIDQWTTTGTIRAYSIESQACNIGTVNLVWGPSPGFTANAYRLFDGRLLQIGQCWVKHAVIAAAGPGCGTCNGAMGSQLGVGCLDVYDAGYNGGQSRLGPRSNVNVFTGSLGAIPPGNFTQTTRRLQLSVGDLSSGNFPDAMYLLEGMFVAADDIAAGNHLNNISHKQFQVVAGTFNLIPQGTMTVGQPAIKAWRANGLGVGELDESVIDGIADVPGEGRFHFVHKAADLGGGQWRYDYAVFNQNSDVAAGSFSIPIPAGVSVTNAGFHDVDYHSGEPYANTNWTITVGPTSVTWSSPETFAANPNTNALRWGTMYNFWFDADAAPGDACATLGLFKPFTPQTIGLAVRAPGGVGPCAAPCAADFNGENGVTVQDIYDFLAMFLVSDPSADFNGVGGVTVQDVYDFLAAWLTGCD